eukprot:scaffold1228_cov119-Cylindrotheca_fusiformis.AAC.6
MEEGNRQQNGDQEFFVYTSETKDADIPKETLTHLRVDSSATQIPDEAFSRCDALLQAQVPETLTRIGKRAFDGCSKLKRFQFVSRNDETVLMDPNLEDGTIVFPESTTLQVDEYAFSSCNSLRNVIVRSNSTKLGRAVFIDCHALVSVELPQGLRVIEMSLFAGCISLTKVNIPSSVIQISRNVFTECRSLTTFDLPHGLLEIGNWAMALCESIQTLHIPTTVATIGENAFERCKRLRIIKLPPTLERIENFTFLGCEWLEHIEIPPTVSFIGQGAFRGCRSLSHLRIPQRVEYIMQWGLENCSNLISIELPEGLWIAEFDSWYRNGYGCPCLVNLAVPTLSMDATLGFGLQDSKLGSVVDSGADLNRKLKHRFGSSPLNKLCYYQSYHSSEDAMLQLSRLMEEDPLAATAQVDEFGMTPLHILSLSQAPTVDMLLTVMNSGHLDHIIEERDLFGSTPMDYLCLNRMPNSAEVIRTVLNSRFSCLLGLNRPWSSDMLQAVDESLAVDWSSRRREIVTIYLKLAKYERQEVLSLVELRLWKVKVDEDSGNERTADRQRCRVMSGASIVVPHVLPFLDNLDVEDYFASPDHSV